MTFSTRVLPAAAIGVALLGLSPVSMAGQVSNAELLQLVRQQAAEIQSLKQRLTTIEKHEQQQEQVVAQTPATAANEPAATPRQQQAAASRLQVQAAVADVRADDLVLARVQASSGGGTGHAARWGKSGEAGPIFSSDDGFFTFKPNGRLLLDFTGTRGSSHDERNINGSQLTSARLGGEGTIGALGYHLEADFADDKVGLRQAYLSYSTRLFGLKSKIYLGNFLKDLGTEGSSQAAHVPFMLRNAATTVGQPVNSYFGLGTQLRVYGNNWHYSLSVSGDAPNRSSNGSSSDSIAYLTRAHWNPVKTGNGFIHTGAWYYYEKISSGVASINNTPAIALDYNDNLKVSASSIADPSEDHAAGYELGGVYRNFWVMAEYAKRTIDSHTADSVTRHGSSLAAGWLLTGEKPGFHSHSGSWGTTKVINPVTSGGWGAFELAGRVDHYDYRGAPRGGNGISYTVGLNWYLNDWSRVMFDYMCWYTNNNVGNYKGPDWGNAFGIRTQVVF